MREVPSGTLGWVRETPAGSLQAHFERLPEGWSEVEHDGAWWGASRTVQLGGRSQKVYAEELGGEGRVSANLYLVGDRAELRPCEMPAEVVLDFLRDLRRKA